MKTLQKLLVIALVVAMLGCAGCAPSGGNTAQADEPPGNDVMVGLIGKTKTEVLTSLSLKEEDLTEFSLYNYMTPLEISYVGVKMNVLLQFGPFDDILNGVIYMAAYEDEAEHAAKDMLAVAKEMQAAFGTPDFGNASRAWEMSEEEIVTAITDDKHLAKEHYWYITDRATSSMKDYMEKLAETDLYQGYNTMGMACGYQCSLALSAYEEETKEAATACIFITYCIGIEKSA